MTKLAGGLFAVVLVSQAGGCYLPPDDSTTNDIATINAQWAFRSEASNATVACPAGFDTIALNSQEIDANGAPASSLIVDLFDCVDGFGASAALPPSVYQTWIEVTNTSTGARFAQSLPAVVDVSTIDKTFDTTILTDGGYFQLDWDLVGATTNKPLDCSDIAGLDGVEAVGTSVSNAENTATDQFTCGDHHGVSGGFLQGAYTVSIDAFDNGKALGKPVSLSNKTIGDRNAVTDLGHITIPITGR